MGLQNGLWDNTEKLPGGRKTEYRSEFGRDRYGDQVKVPPTPAPRTFATNSNGTEVGDTSDLWPTVNSDYGVYANVPRMKKGPNYKKTQYESPWIASGGAPLPPFDPANYMTASNEPYSRKGVDGNRYPVAGEIMQNQFPRFYQSLPRDTSAYTRQTADILKVTQESGEVESGAQEVLPPVDDGNPSNPTPEQTQEQ